ncbi:META domain-containing protein [uncultured Duncaniella sp.]|jgi:Heat shock protein|uniref:META domain-containing protein n=1 Tax=uncultured Duncaniella sp. TaxID=2768039 RepID=UPI0025B66F98|nr:META domain-containing protein [uncultured Duncaniella sp.]
MKLQIKPVLAAAAMTAVIATACSGKKENNTAITDQNTQNVVTDANIRGQWYIENIVFSDSDYVRPDETLSSIHQYIVFEDSTYFIQTNCNTISGAYAVKGDSITIGDGAMTEMACDDMAVEDALRRILPDISTIDVQNDSVVRLNGATPAECILLRKATEKK